MTGFPLEIAIHLNEGETLQDLEAAVRRAIYADPRLACRTDHPGGRVILCGSSERRLDQICRSLRADIGKCFQTGDLQAAWRSCLAQCVDVDTTHKAQAHGSGEFARVIARLGPGARGSGFRFFDQGASGTVPVEVVPSIVNGFEAAAQCEGPHGFPIIDFEVHLLGGAWHPTDSSPQAFEVAARKAMQQAVAAAGTKLLEPIVKLTVEAPQRNTAAVCSELTRRGAAVGRIAANDDGAILAAAPMERLLGFETVLAYLTQGQASLTVTLDRYAEVLANRTGPDGSEPSAAALPR